MSIFLDISRILEKTKIILLGSYSNGPFRVLECLKTYLLRKRFINTSIAADFITIVNEKPYEEKMGKLLEDIIKGMKSADFCVFIFFENEQNDSVIVELASLIHSSTISDNNKILAILPRHYHSSMLTGLISNKKLNIFRYDYITDIFPYCFSYLKRNSIEKFKIK